ncbi:MAG: DUF2750 domain-containing protein [Vulcanimicrobiota bacterium]
MSISPKEFENVSALSGVGRFSHFVKRVADWEELWSLRSPDGWVLRGDEGGGEYVPVWPRAEYALACATDIWADCAPAPIALDEWFAKWTPGMAKDGRRVEVFPTPFASGLVLAPEELAQALREECARYGDYDDCDGGPGGTGP